MPSFDDPRDGFSTPADEAAMEDASISSRLRAEEFRAEDLDITAQQNLLVIQGRKRDDQPEGDMLHVGIANRGFERRFDLADYVRVKAADLKDGMLIIDLVREVPDAMKPKKISIGGKQALEIVKDDDETAAA